MIFQALSVLSPAGSLIRSGRKTIEVRGWQPPTLPLLNLLIVQNSVPLSDETPADDAGAVVALVDVVAVRDWQPEDLEKSRSEKFEEGYQAWELTNVRPAAYNRFVPARLGVYELEVNPKYLMLPDGAYNYVYPEESQAASS
ncbi:MAG: ASCH domain-containing protein [Verrucomicrobia bacterium]|nr:ASCH domain-containing protein [Verrucomicrobiota bacterium]